MPLPVQFKCYMNRTKIEMPCKSISLTFERNVKTKERKKPTIIQVVALAKGNFNRDFFKLSLFFFVRSL